MVSFLDTKKAAISQAEPVAIPTAPEKIWLNIGDTDLAEIKENNWQWNELSEITWCQDKIDQCDIPYIRADLAYTSPPADKQDVNLKQVGYIDDSGNLHKEQRAYGWRAVYIKNGFSTADKQDANYGLCPTCKCAGISRERRPNGNDKCINSHVYPSREAIDTAMKGDKNFGVNMSIDTPEQVKYKNEIARAMLDLADKSIAVMKGE